MIPFAYRSGTSPLHRCPAVLKLLGLLALSVGAFYSAYGLAAVAVLLTAGALTAGLRPRELLRGSKTVFLLAAFFILIRSLRSGGPGPDLAAADPGALFRSFLDIEGFWGGLHQGLCFIVSFAAGALLFSVTTMQELRDSLGRVEAAVVNRFLALGAWFRGGKAPPVKRRAYSGFALGLSLMLGFLPRFFELWETANLACEARAGKQGLRRLIFLVPLTIERMMEQAGETAEALESRGFSLLL
jgi:energy-coupling factor transporter transmembrane protein EcfT